MNVRLTGVDWTPAEALEVALALAAAHVAGRGEELLTGLREALEKQLGGPETKDAQ